MLEAIFKVLLGIFAVKAIVRIMLSLVVLIILSIVGLLNVGNSRMCFELILISPILGLMTICKWILYCILYVISFGIKGV